MNVFQTQRLNIRKLRLSDAVFIYDLVNEPGWLKFIGDKGVNNLQAAETYILQILDSYRKYGFGLYRVEKISSGEAVGICGLVKRDSLQDFDIGFALFEKFEGNGFAQESATAILQLAKDEFKLPRIAAICTRENYSSIRLIERLGFQFDSSVSIDPNGKPLQLFTLVLR